MINSSLWLVFFLAPLGRSERTPIVWVGREPPLERRTMRPLAPSSDFLKTCRDVGAPSSSAESRSLVERIPGIDGAWYCCVHLGPRGRQPALGETQWPQTRLAFLAMLAFWFECGEPQSFGSILSRTRYWAEKGAGGRSYIQNTFNRLFQEVSEKSAKKQGTWLDRIQPFDTYRQGKDSFVHLGQAQKERSVIWLPDGEGYARLASPSDLEGVRKWVFPGSKRGQALLQKLILEKPLPPSASPEYLKRGATVQKAISRLNKQFTVINNYEAEYSDMPTVYDLARAKLKNVETTKGVVAESVVVTYLFHHLNLMFMYWDTKDLIAGSTSSFAKLDIERWSRSLVAPWIERYALDSYELVLKTGDMYPWPFIDWLRAKVLDSPIHSDK